MMSSGFVFWVIQVSNTVALIGVTILLHSSIIITTGLCAAYMLRNKGGALQSFILRLTLVSVLLVPMLSCYISADNTRKITFTLPRFLYNPYESQTSGKYDVSSKKPNTSGKHNIIKELLTCSVEIGDNELKENQKNNVNIAGLKNGKNRFIKLPLTPKAPIAEEPLYRNNHGTKKISDLTIIESKLSGTVSNKSSSSGFLEFFRKSALSVVRHSRLTIVFSVIWLVLLLYLTVRLFLHSVYAIYIRRTSHTAHHSLTEKCSKIAEKIGVQSPLVLQNSSVKSPFVSGIFKPAIFLPLEASGSSFACDEVFAHELAHLKRYDHIWNLVSQIGTAFLPIQPLMWFLSHHIDEAADFVCDDYVVAFTKNHRMYSSLLLKLAIQYKKNSNRIYAGVRFISLKSPLRRRIERILNYSTKRPLKISTATGIALAVVFACILAGTGFVGFERFTIRSGFASETGNQHKRAETPARVLNDTQTSLPPANRAAAELTYLQKQNEFNSSSTPVKIETVPNKKTSNEIADRAVPAHNPGNRQKLADESSPEDITLSINEYKPEIPIVENIVAVSIQPEITPTESSINNESIVISASDENDAPITDKGDENSNVYIHESHETGDDAGRNLFVTSDQIQQYLTGFTAASAQNHPSTNVPKLLPVTVPFDYKNHEFHLNNYEERRLYNVYYGLDKLKNEPAWSPDGRCIAFTDHNRIWIVSSQGGEPKIVYEYFVEGISINNFESLVFTPDSKEIIFKEDVYDAERGSIIKTNSNGITHFTNPYSRVSCVDIDTGEHRVLLENAYRPGLSHDGRYICCLHWNNDYSELFNSRIGSGHGLPVIMDLKTGKTRLLPVDDSKRYGSPTFSPDDSNIVIPVREGDGPIELFSIPLDGNEPEQLTWYDEQNGYGKYINYPEYSPDGNWILFTDFTWTNGLPDKRLFVYSTESGKIFELFEDAPFACSFGAWSGNGSKICFILEEKNGNSIYTTDFTIHDSMKPVNTHSINPQQFTLYGNYPNPFNASTTIDFSLSERGITKLVIYNSLGQKIHVLIDEIIPAGRHRIVWDGRNSSGVNVSSGVYMYHLMSGNRSLTGRMTVVK